MPTDDRRPKRSHYFLFHQSELSSPPFLATLNQNVMGRHPENFPHVPRRDRVHVLRDFIRKNYDLESLRESGRYILDVAGGKGDFSFLIRNADNFENIVVVDPRYTDHSKISRTAHWYSLHHEERIEHAAEGQALPKLNLQPPFYAPLHLRMFFDERLLLALVETDETNWDSYWQEANQRVKKLDSSFHEHHRKKEVMDADGTIPVLASSNLDSAQKAWEVFQSAGLVIGFHPDEATDACVDFCLTYRVPFAICPCCVFPSFFPHRSLKDGRSIRTYDDYVLYLREKHPKIRMDRLPFASSASGHGKGLTRNTVLYMLPSDYDDAL